MHSKLQVLSDALTLPPTERAELIDALFFSFETTDRSRLDQLWGAEAESRIDAYERGEFSAIPADTVFSRLDQ
jgi:putative addiction module component (TIGR02574 family)